MYFKCPRLQHTDTQMCVFDVNTSRVRGREGRTDSLCESSGSHSARAAQQIWADFIQQTSATKKLTFEMRASTRNISGADEVLCSSSVLLLFENSQMGSFNFLFVTQMKGWITGVKIQSTSTVLWNSNCSSFIVPQWGAAAHTHKITTWKNTCCGNHGDLGWSFLGSRLWGASRCLGPGSPPYLLLTSGAGLPTPTITHLGGETFWIVPCSRTPVCT